MAPYCAIPRDYLSNTPLFHAMGFLVSQHGQLGAIPPFPPFLSVSCLESMRSGGAIPPPLKRDISAILARYPVKTRQIMGAIPPSALLSRQGLARYGGGYRSIQIDYTQTLSLRGTSFRLQIQNRAARRINFHYRNRSVGMSAENLSLQIQILS